MPDKKPEPNPKSKSEIPTGKLVPKTDKPPAAKPKAAPAPAAPVARPVAPAAPAPGPVASEYDVDLVAVPCPPPKPREQRTFFDLDRRDFLMAGGGVLATVVAVLVGLLTAKAFSRKSTDEKP